MKRVHVICEGQTEEAFVNKVLYPHLLNIGVLLLPSLIGRKGHKGGNVCYARIVVDIRNRLLGDNDAFCTTFFDFYKLDEGFPGKQSARSKVTAIEKAKCLQEHLVRQLEDDLGSPPLSRFIPYVQMHEFEGLLFSSPNGLAKSLGDPKLADKFQTIRNAKRPEDINEGEQTAPSKRILNFYNRYEKVLDGISAAQAIGLQVMLAECPCFCDWIEKLKAIGENTES